MMANPQKNEYHILVETADKTAVELLSQASNLSKQKVKQAMKKGCVWLEKPSGEESQKQYTQRLRRAKKLLSSGERLHFYYDERVLNEAPTGAILIADRGGYSIWNKPPGMLSQGSKWGDHCTINRWAEKHLQPERSAFIVHRLDRAASGLIILAHKKQVASAFAKMFQASEVKKHYRVCVEGDFSRIITEDNTRKTISSDIDNKNAISHCRIIAYDKSSDESTLDVEIETGRKHQIRRHLAELKFPVVGDRLYGTGKSQENLKLVAVSLEFNCPVSGDKQLFIL